MRKGWLPISQLGIGPATVIGIVYSIATTQYSHLFGALVVFAMYLFLFIMAGGKLGGGDLKLLWPFYSSWAWNR